MTTQIPTYDITIKGGEDFSFTVRLKEEDGSLQNLTGKSFRSQLREFSESGSAIDFVCTHNNQGGEITITLNHNKTAAIRFRSGVYDIIQINGDGTKECILYGVATIIPAVTR